MPGDSEWNVVSKIHFQVAILASAGLSIVENQNVFEGFDTIPIK